MRFLALGVAGLIWASAAGAQNPEEVHGRWAQLSGATPRDSSVFTFSADGRFEFQWVDVESGFEGLYVRARKSLKGTWIVRAPVEEEGQNMMLCIKTSRVRCRPYWITESEDQLILSVGYLDRYYKRLK